MRLEHIGIAVDEVNAVVERFQELLGVRPYKAETIDTQQVRTHFLDAETAKLELLEALDDDSPVQRFLDRRGEGLHHLAFEVEDAAATMTRLRDAGFDLLSETPQHGADDKRIFFVHPKQTHGVLVEFCESIPPSWTPIEVPHRDGTLSVFERGDQSRPSVVFLHGAAGCTLYETAPLMRRLESSFHVIGIDLSGHGASSFPPDGTLSLDVFAADVRAALDALDCASAHVFGFSLGGGAALHFAQQNPARVERLALLQTTVEWTEPLADQMKQRLDLEALQDRSPDRVQQLRSLHDDPERLFRSLRAFVEGLPDTSDALWEPIADVTAPTLVASVDHDPLFGPEVPLALCDHLPNARLAILPGEQHSLAEAPLASLLPLLRHHFSEG